MVHERKAVEKRGETLPRKWTVDDLRKFKGH